MIRVEIVNIYDHPFEIKELPKHLKVKTLNDAKAFIKAWTKYGSNDLIAKVYYFNKSLKEISNFEEISKKYDKPPKFSKLSYWVSYYTLDMIEILNVFEIDVDDLMFITYVYDPFAEFFADMKPGDYIYCITDNRYYRFFDYAKYMKEECLMDPTTEDLIDNITIPSFDRGMPYYFYRKIYPAEKAMLDAKYGEFKGSSI